MPVDTIFKPLFSHGGGSFCGLETGSTWDSRDAVQRRGAENAEEAQRTHFEGGWRVHSRAWGGSGSGDGGTKKVSPLGRKRRGWPGMLPAGDGFGSGVLTVSVASGWVSMAGSFGNSWRRALRGLNSSMGRRGLR